MRTALVAIALSASGGLACAQPGELRPQDVELSLRATMGPQNAFPARARATRTAGEAEILCRVRDHGRITDCAVVRESAEGYGFGRSAVALTERFQVSKTAKDGSSTEGRPFRHIVQFRAADRSGGRVVCPTADNSDRGATQPTILCGW